MRATNSHERKAAWTLSGARPPLLTLLKFILSQTHFVFDMAKKTNVFSAVAASVVLANSLLAQSGAPAASTPVATKAPTPLTPQTLYAIIMFYKSAPSGLLIGTLDDNVKAAIKRNGLDRASFNTHNIYALSQSHPPADPADVDLLMATFQKYKEPESIDDYAMKGLGMPPNIGEGERQVTYTAESGQAANATISYADTNTNVYLFQGFPTNHDFLFGFQAGAVHTDAGPTEDTYWLRAYGYLHPESMRDSFGSKWAVFFPDVFFGVDHSINAYDTNTSGDITNNLGESVQFYAGAYWPVLLTPVSAPTSFLGMTNFSPGRLDVTLGPTYSIGLQKFISGGDQSEIKFSQYGGLRFALNDQTFLDFTLGDDDALKGLRFQVKSQFPIFTTSGGGRYYIRALWNTSHSKTDDIIQILFAVDIPFQDVLKPGQLIKDLVPSSQ